MILIIDSLKTPWFSKSCFFASRNNHVYLSYTTCYIFFIINKVESLQRLDKWYQKCFVLCFLRPCFQNAFLMLLIFHAISIQIQYYIYYMHVRSLVKKKNTPFSFWCSFSAFVAQLLFRYVPLVYGESVLEPTYRVCPIISRRL